MTIDLLEPTGPTERSILRAARERITERAHWTRDALARDCHGYSVPYGSEDACRWCALGALHLAGRRAPGLILDEAIARLAATIRILYRIDGSDDHVISGLNDGTGSERGHQPILRSLDMAIGPDETTS